MHFVLKYTIKKLYNTIIYIYKIDNIIDNIIELLIGYKFSKISLADLFIVNILYNQLHWPTKKLFYASRTLQNISKTLIYSNLYKSHQSTFSISFNFHTKL